MLGRELDLRLFGYRDTTPLPNGQVDDAPYGGGPGMVLRVDVVAAAIDAVYGGLPDHRVIALTPQGRQLDQATVEQLASEERLTLLSARFEGFDERILTHLCSDAISIGPYVLSGGELPAMVLVDAIARLQPGALAKESAEKETFSSDGEHALEGAARGLRGAERSGSPSELRRVAGDLANGGGSLRRARARGGEAPLEPGHPRDT